MEWDHHCFGLLWVFSMYWCCHRKLLKTSDWINSDSTVTQKCKQCVLSLWIQTLDPLFLDRVGVEIWAHSQIKPHSINNSLFLKTSTSPSLIQREGLSQYLFSNSCCCQLLGTDQPSPRCTFYLGLACTCRTGLWKSPAQVVSTGFVLWVLTTHLPLPTHLLHHRGFLPSAGDNPTHSSEFHAGWAFLWHVSSSKSVLCVCPRDSQIISACVFSSVYRHLAIWLVLIWGGGGMFTCRRITSLQNKSCQLACSCWAEPRTSTLVREENEIGGTQTLPSWPPQFKAGISDWSGAFALISMCWHLGEVEGTAPQAAWWGRARSLLSLHSQLRVAWLVLLADPLLWKIHSFLNSHGGTVWDSWVCQELDFSDPCGSLPVQDILW